MTSSNSISFDRNAPRPGFFVRQTDSISISTKRGVDLNGLAMLLESNPIQLIITEAKPGGRSKQTGVIVEAGTTINCLVPSGVHAQFNEFDINVRTIKENQGAHNPHKALTISRNVGQSIMLVRNPQFAAIDAAEDLKTNGIKVLSPNVNGNRTSRISIKATGLWMVVRSELYNPRLMNSSAMTHYKGLLVTSLEVVGTSAVKAQQLSLILERVEKAIVELKSMSNINNEVVEVQNGLSNKKNDIQLKLEQVLKTA